MERTQILLKLTDIFSKQFNISNLILIDSLTANDIEPWDSLSNMLLIAEIENSFSIKFKMKEITKMRNIGDMIDIILTKI